MYRRDGRFTVPSKAVRYTLAEDELLILRGGVLLSGFTEGLVHRGPDCTEPRIAYFAYGEIDSDKLVASY